MVEMIYAFKINEDGFIVDSVVVEKGNTTPFERTEPIPDDVIYKPQWTGSEWIEGKIQAEIEEEEFFNSLIPSTEEIAQAEFEIKILNILMEVELI